MNIDERLIESAITKNTKAIVCVHYAGVSCEMNSILQVARKNNLYVIEDAAQGVMSTYRGKSLGTIGDIGCYSFHETKNYTMGEGGALCINNEKFIENAEIVREKGTNRSKNFRGEIDKYTWVNKGSSFLPSEINAAYLYPQLEIAQKINEDRLALWNSYYEGLVDISEKGLIELPYIPSDCEHNAHMFYIKVKDMDTRTDLINYLKKKDISSVFHYIPLHSSPAGMKYGEFIGKDNYTTKESERLLRLPLYYSMSLEQVNEVVQEIQYYFNGVRSNQ